MHPSDFKRAKKRKTQPERGRSAAGHDGVDPDLRGDCLSGYYGEAGDVSAWPFYYRHDYFYGDAVRTVSYTHLDVYKRQRQTGAPGGRTGPDYLGRCV